MIGIGKYSRICLLLVAVFLVSFSNVQAQDLFREVDQLKSQIAQLRSELNELKTVVYSLRRALLDAGSTQPQRKAEAAAPKEEKSPKPEQSVDEEQLTKTICQAVGNFFVEAEAILRSGDPSTAEDRMNKVLHKLVSKLHGHSGTHRVGKLLDIYEGLAWDTYVAVGQRGSIQGNEDFIRVLAKHKQKFIETCPKH